MNGPPCPQCGRTMEWLSTANAYRHACMPCDERFDDAGRRMRDDWRFAPRGQEIAADVRAMLDTLRNDWRPGALHLPDARVRELGGRPEDYPELEGHPGVRVVAWR